MAPLVLAAVASAGHVAPASARPTHGVIEPLAAGEVLDGLALLPLEVGRTWTYRDGEGNRYRHIVTSPTPLLAADQKIRDRLRRRLVYEVPSGGATHLVERRLLEIDPTVGVVARPDELATADSTRKSRAPSPVRVLELPARLVAGTTWVADGLERRFQGVADLQVEAGSFTRCAVVDAKHARRLPSGEVSDVRSFYCPAVGEAAVLMFVGGTWRPAVELEAVTAPSESTRDRP